MKDLAHARGILVGLGVVLVCGYAGLHYWQEWASEQRLMAASRVSVVELHAAFPPELVVEFENAGEIPIERTHFRLVFEADGREISRADEDLLNVQPKEKRRIVLRSHPSGPSRFHDSRPVRARYVLVVLPQWIRGLPTISREFVLES